MTDLRKAAEMALKYFEDAYGLEDTEVAIKEALRKALEQPEQEPVCFLRETSWSYEIAPWDDPNGIPVYTAPPKKEWVGLTDEEIQAERHKLDTTAGWTYDHFARAIEAKLKDKNI
jgi:hypothetical protein